MWFPHAVRVVRVACSYGGIRVLASAHGLVESCGIGHRGELLIVQRVRVSWAAPKCTSSDASRSVTV
jgi:hypothetical protein